VNLSFFIDIFSALFNRGQAQGPHKYTTELVVQKLVTGFFVTCSSIGIRQQCLFVVDENCHRSQYDRKWHCREKH